MAVFWPQSGRFSKNPKHFARYLRNHLSYVLELYTPVTALKLRNFWHTGIAVWIQGRGDIGKKSAKNRPFSLFFWRFCLLSLEPFVTCLKALHACDCIAITQLLAYRGCCLDTGSRIYWQKVGRKTAIFTFFLAFLPIISRTI